MSWLSRNLSLHHHDSEPPPPTWAPATEEARQWGLVNEASEEEFEAARRFCARNPPESPRYVASNEVDRIRSEGYKAWGLVLSKQPRFSGTVKDVYSTTRRGPKLIEVFSAADCADTCILSNLPIMGGMYDISGKSGVYFEVTILQMDGVIAVGMFPD